MIQAQKAIHSYKSVDTEIQAEYASPYQLTKMLFSGALKSMALIPVLMERKEFEACSNEVSRSVGILTGLREALDLSQGEIAENLYQLYSYMIRELMRAYRANETDAIRRVRGLLAEIDEAWAAIPVEMRG
jgi:flagellar protein FliS